MHQLEQRLEECLATKANSADVPSTSQVTMQHSLSPMHESCMLDRLSRPGLLCNGAIKHAACPHQTGDSCILFTWWRILIIPAALHAPMG